MDSFRLRLSISDLGRDPQNGERLLEAFMKTHPEAGPVVSQNVETGRLVGGMAVTQTIDVTEGGLVATPIENDRRAEALRRMVAAAPDAGTNTVVVTHKPNILDAFGKDWFEIKEGEASVFKPTAGGKAELVARVQAAEWVQAAK